MSVAVEETPPKTMEKFGPFLQLDLNVRIFFTIKNYSLSIPIGERIDRGGSSLWNLKSPSGGVRFRAQLWHHYYPTMDGAIFMVDPNQLNASIDNFGFFVKGYIQTIQKEDFVNRNHTLPVLLLVNKQDSFGNADSVQDTIAIFKEGINPIISASSDFVTVFVRSCSALKRYVSFTLMTRVNLTIALYV